MVTIPLRPAMIEVDLGAAAGNIRAVRRLVGAGRKVFAVDKADGYGFGAAEMGAVFARNGADALELRHLRLGGLCAHPHAEVGVDPAYADWQLRRFTGVVDELEARGVVVPVRLLAATPWVPRFSHAYLNAVDPGRMLYGITFPGETPPVPLRPTFRALTTRVGALKELAPLAPRRACPRAGASCSRRRLAVARTHADRSDRRPRSWRG
jgi:alanine racemase